MTTDNLLFHSKELQVQAYKILDEIKLIHFLSKYGQPKIVGSVALDLMTWRDIDIDLETKDKISENNFWETAKYLLSQERITLITLVDNRKIIEKNRPLSMYIGGRYQTDKSEFWKIDLRFVSRQDAIAQKHLASISSKITDENRINILGIKYLISQDPRYGREISSIDIYTAVLDYGIVDLAGFEKYLKELTKPYE